MSQYNQRVRKEARSHKHAARNVLGAALALALATAGGGAQAATQMVTNCNDAGSGSLRAAIAAAGSGDVVDATALTCSTISLSTGALPVTVKNLTVSGAGPDRLTVTNGAKYGRVFRHEGNGTLTLKGMTISSGAVSPAGTEPGIRGGCIYSKGAVTLGNIFVPTDEASGVVVSDCTAVATQAATRAGGGGIFAKTGVALANSIVTQSRAVAQDAATDASGGGVYLAGGPFLMKYSEVRDCKASGSNGSTGGIFAPFVDTVTVKHSTIAGNTAAVKVGGAYLGTFAGGLLLIDNATISGNSSSGNGGLLLNVVSGQTQGAIHIYSSTITENRSTSGFVDGARVLGTAILQSSIFAGNNSGSNDDLDITGSVTGNNNLLGTTFGMPLAGQIIATDPKLGPLTNRGGPTRTHEPLENSPALDQGNNSSGSTTDQRGPGYPRTLGLTTDIGAFERNPDTIFANGFD